MRNRRTAIVALLAITGLVACGGDDDSSGDAADAAAAEGDAPADDAVATTAADVAPELCGTTDATFENATTGASFAPTSAAAVSLEGGAAYTVYLGDFDIDVDALSFISTPEPGVGEHMVTVAITTFNAEGTPEIPAVGRTIEYQDEFGELTFIVTANEGAEYFGNNSGAGGTVSITAVGDSLCFDIEYSDAEKSFNGTVAAPVKPL